HHAHAGYARPAEQLKRPTPGYPPNADPPHDRAPCQSCFCEKPPPTGASASHATPAYGETMTDYAPAFWRNQSLDRSAVAREQFPPLHTPPRDQPEKSLLLSLHRHTAGCPAWSVARPAYARGKPPDCPERQPEGRHHATTNGHH